MRVAILGVLTGLMTLCLGLGRVAAQPAPGSGAPDATPPALASLHARIVSGDLAGIHGVLVAQDGRTLAEWYFTGADAHRGTPVGQVAFTADTLHDLRSVSKTVVALATGAAVEEGRIKSLDAPVLDAFPEYADLRTPERMKITLRDLLTMSSGLRWDEATLPYTDPRNSETAMDLAPDRLRYVLQQTVVGAPGTTFNYSGGNVALVAEVIRRATGQTLDAYVQAKLFAPLGITRFEWYRDRSGTPIAASGLRLRPRDMAKIGQLMLDKGRYDGRQVVPAAWVEAMSTPKIALGPGACDIRYGYFTWISPGCITDPPTPWFAGIGNGGQRIWVVPSQRLVVVLTEGLYDQRDSKTATAVLKAAIEATAPAR